MVKKVVFIFIFYMIIVESLMMVIESFLFEKGVNIIRVIFVRFDDVNIMSGVYVDICN